MKYSDLKYFERDDVFFLANCKLEEDDSDYAKYINRKVEAAIKHVESLTLQELSKELTIRKMLPEFFDCGIPSQEIFINIYNSHRTLKYYFLEKLPYDLTSYLICGDIDEWVELSKRTVSVTLPKVATDCNKYQEKHLEREIGFLKYYLKKGYFFQLSFASSKEEYEASVREVFPEQEATEYLSLLFENMVVEKESITHKPSGQIAFDDEFTD